MLEAVEQAVATEALRLGERSVRDIMRPRIDLDALDIDTPPGEVLGAIAMAGYSRLPVYEGSLDHILGYVSLKDVLRQTWMGWPIELRKIMHRAVFVPETMPLDRLLELFQKERNQLAMCWRNSSGRSTTSSVAIEKPFSLNEQTARGWLTVARASKNYRNDLTCEWRESPAIIQQCLGLYWDNWSGSQPSAIQHSGGASRLRWWIWTAVASTNSWCTAFPPVFRPRSLPRK